MTLETGILFWKLLSTHVKGMMDSFCLMRKALLQSERGGVFFGLSSIAGLMSDRVAAQYAICKAAADMTIKQLVFEYAPLGL